MLRIGILEPDRYPKRARAILDSLGEVRVKADTISLQQFLSDVSVLVIRLRYLLNREFLDQAPQLKIISTATTGLDHIDLQLAQSRNIAVLSLRGETEFLRTVTATAEHTWGLLLALIRHIPQAHYSAMNDDWNRDRFFGRELQDRTLGIVGLGRIGQMVARYGLAFRMKVIAFDPFQAEWLDGVARATSLKDLAAASDVLSIHVPLSGETTHLIGKDELAALKPGAIVLNTSRGAVLDESALLDSLGDGRIGGAALDVIHDEYSTTSDLRDRLLRYAAFHENLLITPHLGGATHDSLQKVEVFMAEKLARHLKSTT